LCLSGHLKAFIQAKQYFWQRLGTHFTLKQIELKQIDDAVAIVRTSGEPENWQLAFRSGDRDHPQWNRLAGLAHVAISITLVSQPRQRSHPANINDLSLVPYPPCLLGELILMGFRVNLSKLFHAIEQTQCLESLRIILPHIDPTFNITCTLPHLTKLHVSGHPNDIRSFGDYLIHPALENIVIKPRGTLANLNSSPSPHPLQLESVTDVTITGNMSWSTVNKYLLTCKVVRNLHVQLLNQSDAHALLMDLVLRDTQPDLPQLLQYIHVSPVECISGIGHLFERIQESNTSLQTLSLGLLSNTGMPISGISFNLIIPPAVLPSPVMICVDILTGTGVGIRLP
jgi:hypothetical protein